MFLVGCVSALLILSPTKSFATVYDLADDWSDTANPNGVWQYRAGDAAINTHFPTFGPGLITNFNSAQPAWVAAASGPESIPAWFKSTGAIVYLPGTTTPDPTYDAPAGRIITHTTDPDTGIDSAFANVLWTSPISGIATITGDTWLARKSLGRSDDWFVLVNGLVVTDGVVSSTDSYTSANPFLFSNGSGGASVLTFPVSVGTTVDFEAIRAPGDDGDFVGVDLSISVVPEPAPWGLLTIGGVALLRRRTKLRPQWVGSY
jgi:hypothetical protein